MAPNAKVPWLEVVVEAVAGPGAGAVAAAVVVVAVPN